MAKKMRKFTPLESPTLRDKVSKGDGSKSPPFLTGFTEDTNLAEILKYPEMEKILMKYNLPCLGCPMAKFEIKKLKIGEVCKIYGINLESLLKELNEKLITP